MSNFATLIVMLVGIVLAIGIVEYKTSQLEAQQSPTSSSVSVYGQTTQSR